MKRPASFLSFAVLVVWSWGCGPTDAVLAGEAETEFAEQEGELAPGRPQGMFEVRASDVANTEMNRLWLKRVRPGHTKHFWSEDRSRRHESEGEYAFGRGAHANRLKLTTREGKQRFEYTYNTANGELTLTPLDVSGARPFVMINQDCRISGCGAGFNCQDCSQVCEPPMYNSSEPCDRCVPDGAVC